MDKWTVADIPNQSGKTIAITGATSGLGLATSLALAEKGARVILLGRNPAKLADSLSAVAKVATVEPASVQVDLSDLSSVREGAAALTELAPSLDVLINNAGIMATPFGQTADGFELQIGTNHLGHFALTGLVLPTLHHPEARVVTVASLAHNGGNVVVDDLNFQNRKYSAMTAYSQSKLANLLFMSELQRRATAAHWDLISVAAHPGVAATNLAAGMALGNTKVGQLGIKAVAPLLQSAEMGALPSLYAATSPEVIRGQYYGPDGFREMKGHPQLADRSSKARNPKLAAELWEKSEELTGVDYNFGS